MNNQFGTNMGMQYSMAGAQIQKPRMINPLTDEERKALKNNPVDEFNLSITNEELAKSFCTHKENDQYSVIVNPDHTVTCKICHETFNPDVCTPEYIEETSRRMENILQTLKFLGVDLSGDVVRGYFGFLPYVKRIPQLYKLVNNSFGRYNENTLYGGVQQQNTGANIFSMFNSVMNPAVPLYQQQYMNQPLGAPQGGAPVGGQWPTPGVNPFYTQAPQMNMQQQAMMAQGQPPVQAQQPVVPAPQQNQPSVAPVAAQNDDQQKTVTQSMPLSL